MTEEEMKPFKKMYKKAKEDGFKGDYEVIKINEMCYGLRKLFYAVILKLNYDIEMYSEN